MPLATNNTPAAAASDAGPGGGVYQAFKPGTSQSVAYTAATASSIANAVGTSLVRVYSTTDAYIAVASSPTATSASGMPITAFLPEYIVTNPDDKVSGLGQSASGVLWVTPAATTL